MELEVSKLVSVSLAEHEALRTFLGLVPKPFASLARTVGSEKAKITLPFLAVECSFLGSPGPRTLLLSHSNLQVEPLGVVGTVSREGAVGLGGVELSSLSGQW